MTLTGALEPDAQALWGAVAEVLRRCRLATTPAEGIDRALDAIVSVLGADRGIVVLCEADAEVVVHARSAGGPLSPAEREEIGRTVICEARASGRTVFWDPLADQGGSLGELGVLGALAAPVLAPDDEVIAVLYVDVRTIGKSLGETHERFLEVAASVLAPFVRHAHALQRAHDALDAKVARDPASAIPLSELVSSPSLTELTDALEAALSDDLHVLVLGESGSGKTELARALGHARGDGPVLRATLGTSDDLNTITSELFGHVRGAFSGAVQARTGLVAHADGGTLILDEVLNLPPIAQQLLLDVTQFGTYRPLGHDGAQPKRARLKFIAVTNGDLEAAVREGRFRQDLYFRLAGVTLRLPPLRERREDLPMLAERLLRRRDPRRPWRLSLPLRRLLVRSSHPFAGNLRELEAILLHARRRALAEDPNAHVLGVDHLRGELVADALPPSAAPLDDVADAASLEARYAALEMERERLIASERGLLEDAMREENHVVARAARRLGLPRTTLAHRLRMLEVEPQR